MESSSTDSDSDFVALLTSHQQALRLYAASLMAGAPESADVAQQANTTIWKKRADFVPGSNFKAWIFAIVRFEVMDFRKNVAKDARLVFSDELEERFADELPAFANELDARSAALRGCLESLKPAQRELIRHRYTLGTPLKDYAKQIGRSADGLKVTLHRLRSSLATCIERKLKTA
jgi:RNA polymerase sigma-70 factor (ECF subfamily)